MSAADLKTEFTKRIQAMWWLYSISRSFPPTLVMSVPGLVIALSGQKEWARKLWLEYCQGRRPSVDDISTRFTAGSPEDRALLPELTDIFKTFRVLHDYSQEQNHNGRLVEVFFAQAVFEYEGVFGKTPCATRSPDFHELVERRHLFAHCGGVADKRYMKARTGTRFDRRFGVTKEGDRITMTHKDLVDSFRVLLDEASSRYSSRNQ